MDSARNMLHPLPKSPLGGKRAHFPMITKTQILIVLFAVVVSSSNAMAEETLEKRIANLEARVKQLEQSLMPIESSKVEQPTTEKPTPLVINVIPDGTYLVDRKPFDLAGISTKLKEVGALQTKPYIIIRNTEGTDYKRIIEVLDACRKSGLVDVSIATAPAK